MGRMMCQVVRVSENLNTFELRVMDVLYFPPEQFTSI